MVELRLVCPHRQVEALCDALQALQAMSVSVEDADALTDAEQALYGEPGLPPPAAGWQRSGLSALFMQRQQAEAALEALRGGEWSEACRLAEFYDVPEQDWVRLTQSQFAPVPVTADFWIVPSWHEVPAGARQVIRLDPGLAFGTGTHPTTRMCLRWIARQAPVASRRVLDYGCGSGILAIAAARFGATDIDAVDIDPAAVEAARLNAAANQVRLRCGQPDAAIGKYELVLANILARPLCLLAPLLCGHVAAGGTLLLSGILQRQADELAQAYHPHARLVVADAEDGWVLMTAGF
jgi:ribosomal protein L11 methyltransferase